MLRSGAFVTPGFVSDALLAIDSEAIEDALAEYLVSDSILTALAPGGIYQDVAPDTTLGTFVIHSLMTNMDTATMGEGRSMEDDHYLVKAVSSSKSEARAAAARIDDLIENGSLIIDGYTLRGMHRTERVSYLEDNSDGRFYHRGGIYALALDVA